MLDERQETILRLVIEEYIDSAEPVGSRYLAENFDLGVSPATIRNELGFLEKEGFLRQPHTSAGRVPTEMAYRYYLKHLVVKGGHKLTGAPMISSVRGHDPIEAKLKSLARRLVEMSGETAIVAMDAKQNYYTGVSNLFHKPDFHSLEIMKSLSDVIDQFDNVLEKMYETTADKPEVYIGSNNPFGDQMATIVVKYRLPNGQYGLLGLVGPLRMNYTKNLALLERAKQVIDDLYE